MEDTTVTWELSDAIDTLEVTGGCCGIGCCAQPG